MAHLQLWPVPFAVRRQFVGILFFNSHLFNLLGTAFVGLAHKKRSGPVRCYSAAVTFPYQLWILLPLHHCVYGRHEDKTLHPRDISLVGGSGGLNAVRGEINGS